MERIVLDPAILAGKPVVRGTRLSVEFVLDRVADGWPTELIVEQFPGLTPDDVRACIRYAGQVLKAERVYPIPA
ncbi:MAG: DUF433 domain-containing protein [Fimbriiglobus sp.]